MKIRKMLKIVLFGFFGLAALLALAVLAGRMANAQKYKIRSESGVQVDKYITLGGIQQYIQIRGRDAANPVMIVLHGGPGNNMASYAYGWQADFEKDYTVVHWDQRGCGNTYYRNISAEKPTLDLMLSDLDELTDYICSAFDKEKVILMGHSWGTFLGGVYAGKHPEKVAAYVGVGQTADFMKAEQVSAQEAIRLANAAGNNRDAQEISEGLGSLLACRHFGKAEFAEFMRFRVLKEKYLPEQFGNRMILLRVFSPYLTFSDLKWMFSYQLILESYGGLLDEIFISDEAASLYRYPLRYEVPVIMVSGDRDWTTPRGEALEYYRVISAPEKKFITIGNTGHIPFVDQPRAFSGALLKALGEVLA